MRSDDSGKEMEYYRFVRYAKAATGIIFAMGAFVMVVRLEGIQAPMYPVIGMLGLGVMSGVMFDIKGITKIVELVVDVLPWAPKKGKEDAN